MQSLILPRPLGNSKGGRPLKNTFPGALHQGMLYKLSTVGQVIALHVAGDVRAAGAGERDLIPAVSGAGHDLHLVTVFQRGNGGTVRTGAGADIHAACQEFSLEVLFP